MFLIWSKLNKTNVLPVKTFHIFYIKDRFSCLFPNGVLFLKKVLCRSSQSAPSPPDVTNLCSLLQHSTHCWIQSGRTESVNFLSKKQHLGGFYRAKVKVTFSHRVGPQRHPPPTASAELGVAVRAQVPTAICKLGLVADSTGGCIVPMDGRARRRRGLPNHRLPVAGQLLLDSSGKEGRHKVEI